MHRHFGSWCSHNQPSYIHIHISSYVRRRNGNAEKRSCQCWRQAAVAASDREIMWVRALYRISFLFSNSHSSTAKSPEFIFQQFVIFHSCVFNTLHWSALRCTLYSKCSTYVGRHRHAVGMDVQLHEPPAILTQCVRMLFEMRTWNNGKFGSFSITFGKACSFRTRYAPPWNGKWHLVFWIRSIDTF